MTLHSSSRMRRTRNCRPALEKPFEAVRILQSPTYQILNYDIASMIAEQVGFVTPSETLLLKIWQLYTSNDYQSLVALSRVNGFCGSIAHTFIYRNVVLDFTATKALHAARLLNRLQKVSMIMRWALPGFSLPEIYTAYSLKSRCNDPGSRCYPTRKRARTWAPYCHISRL